MVIPEKLDKTMMKKLYSQVARSIITEKVKKREKNHLAINDNYKKIILTMNM